MTISVLDSISESSDSVAKYFPTQLQQFMYYDKYSRWIPELGRRENWPETVDRVMRFLKKNTKTAFTASEWVEMESAFLDLQVMPSMRIVQMAGPALERCNIGAYNCAYIALDCLDAFAELLYVLMQGTGIGYSVEDRYTSRLPRIKRQKRVQPAKHSIPDTTEGWCDALKAGLHAWVCGTDIEFDFSAIRPSGAILRTKGGRACLTGDTRLILDKPNRKGYKKKDTVTVAELYAKFIHRFPDGRLNGAAKKTKLRCLDEQTGTFYRNSVLGVVDNGIADVYEITTQKGYKIRATQNHRFMDSSRVYRHVVNFTVGDLIAVNGSELKTAKCVDCGTDIYRRSTRCKTCNDTAQQKSDCAKTTARGRKQCRDYSVCIDRCEACGMSDVRLTVHHIDEDTRNNDWSNLQKLCEKCHQGLHAIRRADGDPYRQTWVTFDTITSIVHAGEDRVYDLVMAAPNHNFVANGFVSHNSGPQPLKDLLAFARSTILAKQGKKLSPLDCHDIACYCGFIVHVGGVRRAALISLSDFEDTEVAVCKNGEFWNRFPYRSMSNNSAVHEEKPSAVDFMEEWLNLAKSGTGERGIFNRNCVIPSRRKRVDFGLNPCGEVVLRNAGLCNLSIAVAREYDDIDSLRRKVRIAAMFGTAQCTLTHFPYLSPRWAKNCEEERLLGVDVTGQRDCRLLQGSSAADVFTVLKATVVTTNAELAKRFGINPSVATTCVKPSGNSSQLLACSNGLHTRDSAFYIRRVRTGANTPVASLLKACGVPFSPETGQDITNPTVLVFEFPVKSPDGAILRKDVTAQEQFEYWLLNRENYTEHGASCTISVKDDEWLSLGALVYDNWDSLCGLSFLPKDNHIYPLAPYEEISEQEYTRRKDSFPVIDWSRLTDYEKEDRTELARDYACVSGHCDL